MCDQINDQPILRAKHYLVVSLSRVAIEILNRLDQTGFNDNSITLQSVLLIQPWWRLTKSDLTTKIKISQRVPWRICTRRSGEEVKRCNDNINILLCFRDLKSDFQQVEEKMRSAVESLPQPVRAGYYPGKFTEKMERRGLTLTGDGQTYLQIPVQRQEGRRGKVLRSWTPWPSWTIRYNNNILHTYY